jgi:hypothetical protein
MAAGQGFYLPASSISAGPATPQPAAFLSQGLTDVWPSGRVLWIIIAVSAAIALVLVALLWWHG